MKKNYSFFFVLSLVFMLAIPFQTAADDYVRGDVDEDGNVSIKDVTCLIDYLLSNQWPEEQPKPENTDYTVGNVTFTMIYVEGGMFTMGATAEQGSSAESDEKPAHRVTLSSFYICSTEVTQELWLEVMGTNPSHFIGENLPVELVNWNACQEFITKLNTATGLHFRLPTEAEWEYAARGGNKSQGYKYSGSNTVGNVAWYGLNSSSKTHPVATKAPNELGIYDMSGNVAEYCQDWYGSYSTAQTDPTGPTSGSYKVLRGGYIGQLENYCRVSNREQVKPATTFGNPAPYYGLRLAMSYAE
jgi:formylglycine-generating enzyme required for sulfatase activity